MPGQDPSIEPRPERELRPEEVQAGSDDPDAQAKAILDDAEARAKVTRLTPGVERRASEDTVDLTPGIDTGEVKAIDVSETGGPAGA